MRGRCQKAVEPLPRPRYRAGRMEEKIPGCPLGPVLVRELPGPGRPPAEPPACREPKPQPRTANPGPGRQTPAPGGKPRPRAANPALLRMLRYPAIARHHHPLRKDMPPHRRFERITGSARPQVEADVQRINTEEIAVIAAGGIRWRIARVAGRIHTAHAGAGVLADARRRLYVPKQPVCEHALRCVGVVHDEG